MIEHLDSEPATPDSSSGNRANKLDVDSAISFLQAIWLYSSPDARCFSIVVIDRDVSYRHFCLDNKGFDSVLSSVKRYVSRLDPSKHVYFQVLPLAKKPEKGRGSEKDVKVGRWLWVDFDYKGVVDKPGFEGCRELEDYALECYYQEGANGYTSEDPR